MLHADVHMDLTLTLFYQLYNAQIRISQETDISVPMTTCSSCILRCVVAILVPPVTWRSVTDSGKSHKYVCITTYQPDTKSNPNPNPTTKQHAIVNIQLNIVTCPTYPDKLRQDMLLHHCYYFPLSLSLCYSRQAHSKTTQCDD